MDFLLELKVFVLIVNGLAAVMDSGTPCTVDTQFKTLVFLFVEGLSV